MPTSDILAVPSLRLQGDVTEQRWSVAKGGVGSGRTACEGAAASRPLWKGPLLCAPRQEDVRRLDIEMYDALGVQVCKQGGLQGGELLVGGGAAAAAQGTSRARCSRSPHAATAQRHRLTGQAARHVQSNLRREGGRAAPCGLMGHGAASAPCRLHPWRAAAAQQRSDSIALLMPRSPPSCRAGTRSPAPPSGCESGCRRRSLHGQEEARQAATGARTVARAGGACTVQESGGPGAASPSPAPSLV